MRSFILLSLSAVLASAASPSFNDATYLAKSAIEKSALVMQQVAANTTPLDWYNSVQEATLLTESMTPTITQVGDEMPKGQIYGTRSKLIHTQGAVATVKLTNAGNHPFTGIFKGADHGVVRLSVAKEPDTKVKNLAPGMGLKFLRDGMDSASLVAMYSVDGQDSWNFFKNDFSNHIPAVSSASLFPVAAKFSTVTDYIQTVGLSDFAQHDQKGAAVASPVFPFSLRFHPTGQFEFPDDYSGTYFLQQLETIPSGSTLYKIYGMTAPKELGGVEHYIGDLITTSKLSSSNWGDSHLFFRHQLMDDDLKIHPEWTSYTPKFKIFEEVSTTVQETAMRAVKGCPFAFLFQ